MLLLVVVVALVQVLSSEAERVLLQLFSQFSTETAEASPGRGRVITEEGQAEVS